METAEALEADNVVESQDPEQERPDAKLEAAPEKETPAKKTANPKEILENSPKSTPVAENKSRPENPKTDLSSLLKQPAAAPVQNTPAAAPTAPMRNNFV